MTEDSPAVADAGFAIVKKEIVLGIDINQDLLATGFYKLPNHFPAHT
jgi:hypothetical protein